MATKFGLLQDRDGNDFLPRTDSSLVQGLEDLPTIRQRSAGALQFTYSGEATPVSPAQYEAVTNKTTTLNNETTNTQYPGAKAVLDAIGKWGVVSQTQTWTGNASTGYTYTMSNVVRGLIPQSSIDLYTKAGAVFNATTGYFEMNGITDLSYEEIQLAYSAVYENYGHWVSFNTGAYVANIRTTFPLAYGITTDANLITFKRVTSVHMLYWTEMSNMEILRVTRDTDRMIVLSAQSGYLFYSNARLKEVQGIIDVYNCSTGLSNGYFFNSPVLETIKLMELRSSWKNTSPNLSLESIVYAVDHSANGTTAITLTLHADAYARCQADTTSYTYNSQTYTGILAYASARNITIAQAA